MAIFCHTIQGNENKIKISADLSSSSVEEIMSRAQQLIAKKYDRLVLFVDTKNVSDGLWECTWLLY